MRNCRTSLLIPNCKAKFATADVDHTLLTGVDFMRMRNDIDSWFGYAGSVTPSDIYNLDRSDFDFGSHPGPSGPYKVLNKQKQTGLYVQDQMQWDKVLVTLVVVMTGLTRSPSTVFTVLPISAMTNSSPGVAVLTTCSTMAYPVFQL